MRFCDKMELRKFVREKKWILSELRYVNLLGVVGALGVLCDALQSKIGTIFIARTSGADIGNKVSALYLGQIVVFTTSYPVSQGISMGIRTLCSQAYGAANYELMGTYFMRGLMIASLTCFPICSIWLIVKPAVSYITQDTVLAQGAGDYTTILCFFYPAYLYSRLACSFLQSQKIVFPVLSIQMSGNLLNICLQYLFVVRLQLDIKGAAVSYVISTYLIAVLVFAYIQFTSSHLTYSMFSWTYLAGWYHFLEYGGVRLLQMVINTTANRLVPVLLIGIVLRNTDQFALLGILNVVWYFFYTVASGLGTGAGIRVGILLGKNDTSRAKKSIVLFLLFSFCVEISLQVIIISLSPYIASLFTSAPGFRKQIEIGLKIISIGTFADVVFVSRNICTSCGLQKRSFIGQLFIMAFGMATGCVLVYFVEWKAAGYYLSVCISRSICCFYDLLLLYLSSWEKIAKKVHQNIHINNGHDRSENETSFFKHQKILLFFRYTIPLLTGFIVFTVLVLAYNLVEKS